MAGTLVEYARFREVQERRARLIEQVEPTQAADPPAAETAPDASVSRIVKSTTQGAVDVR